MSAGRISQGRETEETGWQLQNRTNLTYGTYRLKQQLGQRDSRSLCPKGVGLVIQPSSVALDSWPVATWHMLVKSHTIQSSKQRDGLIYLCKVMLFR